MKPNLPRYGVMGNPIAHSKSPMIQSYFAEQTGISLDYEAILVPTAGFTDAVIAFQQNNGKGLNVTLPFKQQAFMLMDVLGVNAQQAGAVNTIVFQAGGLRFGENTDGTGFVRDFVINQGGQLKNKKVLLVGAGGAARGVIGPILAEEPDYLVVCNRTVSRAETLAKTFSELGTISACGFDTVGDKHYDVIINATSAGLLGEALPLPDKIFQAEPWCYDMVYGKNATLFLDHAKALGAKKCIDGIGMLVEQAAESFYLWHQVRPKTQALIEQLRNPAPAESNALTL